jgi:hypothetical protein
MKKVSIIPVIAAMQDGQTVKR